MGNKNIKKIIRCFLGFGLAFSFGILPLTGCGSADSESSASADGKYIYISTDDLDTFRASLKDAMSEAAADAGITLDVQEVGNSVEAQVQAAEKAQSEGYSGIVCRLADTQTALQIELAAGDLPVVFVNNEPDEERLSDSKYIFVGSQENQAGEYEAEYVYEKLGKPTSINLVIIKGEKGHSATEARTNAAKNYLKDQGCNVNITFCDFANWDTQTAYDLLATADEVGVQYDAIICNNDSMAIGAVQYLEESGKSPADIPVTGVDATADGCASIAAGGMQFTVLQNAKGQAEKAIEAVQVMASEKTIADIEGASEDGKYVWVPFEKVDADNVKNYQ